MPQRRRPVQALDPKRAVACLRVSTTKEKQALGIEAQRAAIEAWAKRERVRVVAWHVDEVSGAAEIGKRPGLLAALADLPVHGAGTLVFQKVDRFTRDATAAALVGIELERHGARLAFADGSGSGDDPTSRLVRGVLVAVAEFERAMIAARIKAALAVKRDRGESLGAPPYGMRWAPGRVHERHPEEAATLARVRALRASGLTVRATLQRATAEGLRGRTGQPFTLAAVHAMVRAS